MFGRENVVGALFENALTRRAVIAPFRLLTITETYLEKPWFGIFYNYKYVLLETNDH